MVDKNYSLKYNIDKFFKRFRGLEYNLNINKELAINNTNLQKFDRPSTTRVSKYEIVQVKLLKRKKKVPLVLISLTTGTILQVSPNIFKETEI